MKILSVRISLNLLKYVSREQHCLLIKPICEFYIVTLNLMSIFRCELNVDVLSLTQNLFLTVPHFLQTRAIIH
jgi:hypothetical protein